MDVSRPSARPRSRPVYVERERDGYTDKQIMYAEKLPECAAAESDSGADAATSVMTFILSYVDCKIDKKQERLSVSKTPVVLGYIAAGRSKLNL